MAKSNDNEKSGHLDQKRKKIEKAKTKCQDKEKVAFLHLLAMQHASSREGNSHLYEYKVKW